MVQFLKSSAMTEHSHPWDSSCCDSSSRTTTTTTKTKTHRRPSSSLTSPLFAGGIAAEAQSILFPNGNGGSHTTTTNITNNTDTTKALRNDMTIPKLTAVRAANELEHSFKCLFSELKRCNAENRKSTILSSVPVRARPKT
mmetsp:Transcript_38066/g.38452  ORF Transcript_38066/g.38452 Transcript_38066/m.38452 type:complete len:141 (-) Transcript_38066:300-722(-)